MNNLTRRKVAAKKRRRTTFSSQLHRNDAHTLLSCKDALKSVGDLKSKSVVPNQSSTKPLKKQFSKRSIIQKMLISPEQLAVIALAWKNFADVKYIIEVSREW